MPGVQESRLILAAESDPPATMRRLTRRIDRAGRERPWVARAMHNPFMARAIELAVEGVQSGRGGPFGAVIVLGGKIIAEGANLVTSLNDPTAHAEVLAIRNACRELGVFELKDCELFTSCEPCPMCLGAIYWARISRLYFASTAKDAALAGFDDSFIYDELKLEYAERRIPAIQMMREEALAGFRAWADQPNRIPY